MATNNQRREAARRQLEQQLAQRQRQQSHKRGQMLIVSISASVVVVILAVVLIAILNRDGKKTPVAAPLTSSAIASSTASDVPTDSAAASPTAAAVSHAPLPARTASAIAARSPKSTSGPCKFTETAAALTRGNLFDVGLPADPSPSPSTALTATFTTNQGAIIATLDAAAAPCNVQSIAYLISQKFYDGTACPRSVNTGIFVVQCGDPSATTSGGPTYTTKDENLAAANYTAGTIAMANSGPDTNGSQFFFITKDGGGLGKSYTVLGHVTEGLDVLQKVAAAGDDGSNSAGGGRPNLDLIFNTVTVS